MKHVTTIQRSKKPVPLRFVIERYNLIYQYLVDNYREEANSPDAASSSLLRDAVLEGVLLGLRWVAGGSDDIQYIADFKDTMSKYLYDNPGVYGHT